MAKKSNKVFEAKLTTLQISNKLRLTGLNRKIVNIRYYNQEPMTEKEWLETFKSIGLDF